MKKFTFTEIGATESIVAEIDRLKIEIEKCRHDGSIFVWNTEYNGEPIVGNLCNCCGKMWGTKK